MFEVELKFAVADLHVIAAKLRELGATLAEPVVQVDQYFAHPSRDFAETDEALRIRQVGQRNCITYKGPRLDATTKTRREIELPLVNGEDHADAFGELLASLGFSPAGIVRKTRRAARFAYDGWQVEAALDTVDGLGDFVELELQADQPQLDDARGVLSKLAGELGLTAGERRSYLELLQAK